MKDLVYRKITASNNTDIKRLQLVLESAPNYYLTIQGTRPSSDEAFSELTSSPKGLPFENKSFYLIEQDTKAIGCFDILKGYPSKKVAFIGLLLFVESQQGNGLGSRALKFALSLAIKWQLEKIQIAVVQNNHQALDFWEKEGFVELYRQESDDYLAPIIVLELELNQ